MAEVTVTVKDSSGTVRDMPLADTGSGVSPQHVIIGPNSGGTDFNQAQVSDSGALKVDATLDTSDLATQATLASLLTELEGKADGDETQPVSVASLPLPSGAATQTTLAAILSDLQNKADKGETQPVAPQGTSATIDAVSVTTSAQSLNSLVSSVKTGRVAVEIQNLGSGTVYVGGSGVTSGNGRKVAVDEAWSPPLDASSTLYLIGDAAATVAITQI